MSLKLDLYKIFCSVVQTGSFSKTAKELFMTQPAVSQSISQLESALSTRLFNRTPKGVSLTREGQLLYEHAHSAIHILNRGEQKLQELQGILIGELSIGVGDTTTKAFLLPFLDQFHKEYSHIKLNIVNGTTFELCDLLKSGKVDIAICNLPLEDHLIVTEPSISIQDIFVGGPNFKDLFNHPYTWEELVQLPLIFLEKKSNSRHYVEDFLTSRKVKLSPEIELGSHDLLISLAEINLGISCVVKEYAKDSLQAGRLFEVPLVESIPERHIGLCYLKKVDLSPGAQRFVELIKTKT